MIPVWVLGGYLGAGKTTFLNAVLRAGTVRTAVLVNDFGDVNIDAQLIASAGAQTIELTNGCTCCTIGGDLILALKDLIERKVPPERIVIEASGVADPRAVARLADCHPDLSVRGAIVVVDAETIRERVDDKYVGRLVRRQLGAADVLVAAKVDLVGAEALQALRLWLAAEAPDVPVFESAKGNVPPVDVLLDPALIADLRERAPEPGPSAHTAFATVTFRAGAPLDRARFEAAAQAMIPNVARAKGTVAFADDPHAWFLFQCAGARWSVEPLPAGMAATAVQLVLIAPAGRERALADAVEGLRRSEV